MNRAERRAQKQCKHARMFRKYLNNGSVEVCPDCGYTQNPEPA